MGDARTITVVCGMPSGLVIRSYETKPVEGLPHAIPDRAQTVLHYGENPGVDAEQFEKWSVDNKDSDIILNGLVYAMPDVPEEALKPLEPVAQPMASEPAEEPHEDEAAKDEGVQSEFTANEEHA